MSIVERARRLPSLSVNASINFLRQRPALRRVLRPIVRPVLSLLRPAAENSTPAYQRWVALHDTLRDADRAAIRAHIATLPRAPLISVVMPAYDTPEPFLRAAIASVQAQLWPHWELCVADDASPSPHVGAILAAAAAADPRIRWTRRPVNGHICAASNTALELATGDWVALLDHDDILPEHALYELAVEAMAHPQAQIIYSDEDNIDAHGRRSGAYFKPDFDPDLLLGQNLISHLGAYRRDLLRRLGGLREGFEGSQDHDLALRAVAAAGEAAVRHIPKVLYHWRQAAGPASFSEASQQRCIDASRRAVRDHLAELGLRGHVATAPLAPAFGRVVWALPDPPPLVSVVVTTRDRPDLLARCLKGVLSRTDYPAIEVLVAEGGTSACSGHLPGDRRVRILSLPGPVGSARLTNRAAAEARGEILLLLADGIDVIRLDWMQEMVSQSLRPAIGAVGCKLLFRNDTLEDGGTVLGVGGVAAPCLAGTPRASPGPSGLLAVARSVSAVPAACLAVRRAVFDAVGGFDETGLPARFGAVDFCLRVRAAGWRNLWTPFAELHHLESASRGDDPAEEQAEWFRREVEVMQRRWGAALTADPYWNPNLSLANARRDFADPPRRIEPWRGAPAERSRLLADAGGPV